ncbi:MAG: hypothetical protein HY262_00480 [Chloroflexi bacterium]|nr:hypothetical protein [Chloroflexota bacterium]
MDTLHLVLAYLAVAGVAIGLAWSAFLVVTRRPGGPTFERLQAAVVAALIVGAASGLLRLASGARPADGLHLLYAAIAIGLIPLARSFTGRASGRGPAVFLLVAFVVLGAVLFRLFTTG